MKVFLVLFFGAAVAAVVLGGFYLGQQKKTQNQPQQPQNTATPLLTPTPTIPPEKTGTIEGSLSYPSEGIPEDLIVCAENTVTEQSFCTSQHLKNSKYTYGVGYKLEVVEGVYLVYAKLPNEEQLAYYSEFVTCGLSVNCPSHKPIEVTVTGGETTTDVDPADWYNTTPTN